MLEHFLESIQEVFGMWITAIKPIAIGITVFLGVFVPAILVLFILLKALVYVGVAPVIVALFLLFGIVGSFVFAGHNMINFFETTDS